MGATGPVSRRERFRWTRSRSTRTLPTAGAFRGFGFPQLGWAHESQMDMIASRLGLIRLSCGCQRAPGRRRFATGESMATATTASCWKTQRAVPHPGAWLPRDVPDCERRDGARRSGSPSRPRPPSCRASRRHRQAQRRRVPDAPRGERRHGPGGHDGARADGRGSVGHRSQPWSKSAAWTPTRARSTS